MLSLKNLELLIVISVRFRGAVPAAGGPAFTLGCCILIPRMSSCTGRATVFAPSSLTSLTRPTTGNGEEHSNHSCLVIHLGSQAVIQLTVPRSTRNPTRLDIQTPRYNQSSEQPQTSFQLLLKVRTRSQLSSFISRPQPFLPAPLTLTSETPLPKLMLSSPNRQTRVYVADQKLLP